MLSGQESSIILIHQGGSSQQKWTGSLVSQVAGAARRGDKREVHVFFYATHTRPSQQERAVSGGEAEHQDFADIFHANSLNSISKDERPLGYSDPETVTLSEETKMQILQFLNKNK